MMNDYIFTFMPEVKFSHELERLRIRLTGNGLVDAFLPHLTLKRRFSLMTGRSADDLMKILNSFSLPKITAIKNKIVRLGEVLVVKIDNPELKKYNRALVELLSDISTTKEPKYENDNFTAHLTLVRDRDGRFSESDFFGLKIR